MAQTETGKIKLVVVTPYKTFFEDEVDIIALPSPDGEIGIMRGHSPLVMALTPGVCRITVGEEKRLFSCSEGYAEIGHEVVLVICNSAEWPDEISISRIVKAYKDAVKRISEEKEAQSKEGRQLTADSLNMLHRSKARMHLIELAGSDSQKERLSKLKSENDIA